jgi:hypothetical protein
MGMRLEITCVTPSEGKFPYEKIAFIGGNFPDGRHFKFSHPEAIELIEKNTYDFYMMRRGRTLGIMVKETMKGRKYLITTLDYEHPQFLLELPGCL